MINSIAKNKWPRDRLDSRGQVLGHSENFGGGWTAEVGASTAERRKGPGLDGHQSGGRQTVCERVWQVINRSLAGNPI